MSDILDDLRSVEITGGNTYSSYEVIVMVGRARQEIERLREGNERQHKRYGAEIERLNGIVQFCETASKQQREGFQAEIERLQEEVAQAKRYETCLHENLVAHELANERLTAALREIADLSSVSVRAPHIARAALEGKP